METFITVPMQGAVFYLNQNRKNTSYNSGEKRKFEKIQKTFSL